MEYQQIAAAWFMPCLVRMPCVSWKVLVRCWWVVFGTLLGPEATGAGDVSSWCLFVSGFLAAPSAHGGSFFGKGGVWGVWYGVVV